MLDNEGVHWKEVMFDVHYDTENACQINCFCHLFESRGILCRHVISVLTMNNFTKVSTCYVLD